MIVRVTINGVSSFWHEQLDGSLIDPARCICLNNENPELACPIDDHVIRYLVTHDAWQSLKTERVKDLRRIEADCDASRRLREDASYLFTR